MDPVLILGAPEAIPSGSILVDPFDERQPEGSHG